MKKDKKILKSASMVAGALMTSALVTAPAGGMDILAFNDLGSGSQVRSHLIDANSNQGISTEASTVKYAELKCGEDGKKADKKAEGEKSDAKKTDAKATEASTADAKKADAKKTETKATEEKGSEAKCGEGKCGEGKCGA